MGFAVALVASLLPAGENAASAQSGRHRRDAGTDAAAASASDAASSASAQSSAVAPAASAGDAPPQASASAAELIVPEGAGAPVRIRASRWQRDERTVFTVRVPLGGRSAQERARAASQALAQVIEGGEPSNVHFETQGDTAVVYVGERPIIELGQPDAIAAGDASLAVHAASIKAKVLDGLRAEQKRNTLVSIGLNVLIVLVSGLFALYLSRKFRKLARAAHSWLNEPDRLPTLRVQSIEVIRPGILRLLLSGSARLLNIVVQVGIAYGWLLTALYVFEPTRGYTEKLTDLVLSPLSSFTSKVAGSLPVLIVAGISVSALVVLIRFVGLFFGSAQRGETTIAWVPPDLIGPTSLVVRFTLVVLFLIIALPFITGNEALSRMGLVALISLGFASTPLLASACVGAAVIYGRGLRTGDFASFGAFSGRIQAVTLLAVRLTDERGTEIRIPHLVSLLSPTRIFGPQRPVTTTVTVSIQAPQAAVRALLAEVAANVGSDPTLELLAIDARGVSYRVTVVSDLVNAPQQLCVAVADAVAERKVPLGLPPAGPPPAP
jgi:small-conductance mechanosensitive channel